MALAAWQEELCEKGAGAGQRWCSGEGGGVTLGWMLRCLLMWACPDPAGPSTVISDHCRGPSRNTGGGLPGAAAHLP